MPGPVPLNADLWLLWLHVQTQWRAGGMGVIGLDWPAVMLMAKWLGYDLRIPRLYRGLQLCEQAVLKAQSRASRQQQQQRGATAGPRASSGLLGQGVASPAK